MTSSSRGEGDPSPAHVPEAGRLVTEPAGSVFSRVLNLGKAALTLRERLHAIEKQGELSERLLRELTRDHYAVAMRVERLAGELSSFEKRLADRERMMEALFERRLREEVERAVARLHPGSSPPKRSR